MDRTSILRVRDLAVVPTGTDYYVDTISGTARLLTSDNELFQYIDCHRVHTHHDPHLCISMRLATVTWVSSFDCSHPSLRIDP